MNVEITGNDRDWIQVTFPYNVEILDAIKNVPGRRWVANRKIWLIPNRNSTIQLLLMELYNTGRFNIPESNIFKQKDEKESGVFDETVISQLEKTLRFLKWLCLRSVVVLPTAPEKVMLAC